LFFCQALAVNGPDVEEAQKRADRTFQENFAEIQAATAVEMSH
jgi:hypothetical protein